MENTSKFATTQFSRMELDKKFLQEELNKILDRKKSCYAEGYFDLYKNAFCEGFWSYFSNKKIDENPYEESGLERETTYEDKCHFQWYSGWWNAYDLKQDCF
jgi:hypothetical protein